MPSFKEPNFQDRVASASKAKADALAKLRAKPPRDEAEVAERAKRAEEQAAAKAEAARAKRAAREEEKAAKAAAAEAAAQEAEKNRKVPLTEAEKKAERDARYAARKARRKYRAIHDPARADRDRPGTRRGRASSFPARPGPYDRGRSQ